MKNYSKYLKILQLKLSSKKGCTVGQLLISSPFPPSWHKQPNTDEELTDMLASLLNVHSQSTINTTVLIFLEKLLKNLLKSISNTGVHIYSNKNHSYNLRSAQISHSLLTVYANVEKQNTWKCTDRHSTITLAPLHSVSLCYT